MKLKEKFSLRYIRYLFCTHAWKIEEDKGGFIHYTLVHCPKCGIYRSLFGWKTVMRFLNKNGHWGNGKWECHNK